MRSIAIINQKGGVGKTTTAVNLSAALAAQGQRVCLIDMDPQAHATLHLGLVLDDQAPSIYDLLTSEASFNNVSCEISDLLTVVPAHLDLAAAEMELAGEVGREIILRDKLNGLEDQFDFLIIDCPPSLGVLTLNALTAVQEVFLPLQPHFLALHGLSKLLRTVDLVGKRLNPQLRLTGIVYCMYESGTRLAAEVQRDVDEFFMTGQDPTVTWAGAQPFETRIRRNIRLAEAPSFGQSILEYAPRSHGAEDYRQLADELLGVSAASSDSPDDVGEPLSSGATTVTTTTHAAMRKATMRKETVRKETTTKATTRKTTLHADESPEQVIEVTRQSRRQPGPHATKAARAEPLAVASSITRFEESTGFID